MIASSQEFLEPITVVVEVRLAERWGEDCKEGAIALHSYAGCNRVTISTPIKSRKGGSSSLTLGLVSYPAQNIGSSRRKCDRSCKGALPFSKTATAIRIDERDRIYCK